MKEYRKLLVLQYLNEIKKEYTIQGIFARLGFEMETGNKLLDEMFKEDLLKYENNLITITKKGRKILDKAPNNYMKIYKGNIFIHDILPKLKKDDIYIPKDFNLC